MLSEFLRHNESEDNLKHSMGILSRKVAECFGPCSCFHYKTVCRVSQMIPDGTAEPTNLAD